MGSKSGLRETHVGTLGAKTTGETFVGGMRVVCINVVWS